MSRTQQLPWAFSNVWCRALFFALFAWLPDIPRWSSPLRAALLPLRLRRCPLGGHPRPASLPKPSYTAQDLWHSHASDDQQITSRSLFFSPDVPPESPGIHPGAYWNPHLDKPQTPKFHEVHKSLSLSPSPQTPLLGWALQPPNWLGQKPENLSFPLKSH